MTTQQTGAPIYSQHEPSRYPHAGVEREYPKAVTWGVRLLLLGLALQGFASIL